MLTRTVLGLLSIAVRTSRCGRCATPGCTRWWDRLLPRAFPAGSRSRFHEHGDAVWSWQFSWPRAAALRHHALMTVWASRTGDGVPPPELAACARLGLLPIEKVPL